MNDFKSDLMEDAIYITSWAAYNDGNSLSDGDWFKLADLVDLSQEEFFDQLRLVGLEPDGYDEELVIHDYDSYSGIDYYDIFGEAYPTRVIDFYRKLQNLPEDELGAFIGMLQSRGVEDAMEALNEDELGNYNIMDEDAFDSMLQEDIESMAGNPRFIDTFRRYIDYEDLRRDLEFDISYDEETGEPEYEIDDYFLEDVIATASMDFLERYFDFDQWKKDVLDDGYYEEFEWEGDTYYFYEW